MHDTGASRRQGARVYTFVPPLGEAGEGHRRRSVRYLRMQLPSEAGLDLKQPLEDDWRQLRDSLPQSLAAVSAFPRAPGHACVCAWP